MTSDLCHPCGVRPWGNFFCSNGLDIRSSSLGRLSKLPDELLLEIFGACDAFTLARLQLVSRAVYCYSSHEDLWRALVLQTLEGNWDWSGSWQRTYVSAHHAPPRNARHKRAASAEDMDLDAAPKPKRRRSHRPGDKDNDGSGGGEEAVEVVDCRRAVQGGCSSSGAASPSSALPLRVEGMYSDLLYQPWLCAKVDLAPEWLATQNVDRRSGLSLQDFREQYELPNRPVIITDVVRDWPACSTRRWTRDYLSDALGKRKVLAGGYEMDFERYCRYSDGQSDEMPLYLFDKKIIDKVPRLAADFTVPKYFQEDLFSVLDNVWRPDYRWLVVGPARSGSSFHVDPNATSAWNAVISGAKKWVLYPPGSVPPGVHPSADGADVAAPVSIAEWYLNFWPAAQEGKVQPLECIVREGEVLFVPRGWWHCVWNLEESVAVTQNYVGAANLGAVLRFLSSKRGDLVSGCAPEDRGLLHARFLAGLQQKKPELLRLIDEQEATRRAKQQEQQSLAALFGRGPAKGAAAAPAAAASCAVVMEAEDEGEGSKPAAPQQGGVGEFGVQGDTSAAAAWPAGGDGGPPASVPFSFGFSVTPQQ